MTENRLVKLPLRTSENAFVISTEKKMPRDLSFLLFLGIQIFFLE